MRDLIASLMMIGAFSLGTLVVWWDEVFPGRK
jgi:hypothetical protein